MFYIIFAIHIAICVLIIGLVLLQQGKGAEAGAVFGSNSDAVLGPGSAPGFFTKLTTGLAIAFMFTSIFLVKSYLEQGAAKTAAAVVSSEKPDVANDTLFAGQLKTEEKTEEPKAEQAPVAEAKVAEPLAEKQAENTQAPAQ